MKLRHLLCGALLFSASLSQAQTPGGDALHIDYIQFTQDNQLRFINAGNDASLNPGGNLTMELWFKVYATTWNQKMIGKLNPNFNSGYMMGIDQGNIYPEIWTPNLNQIQDGGIPATPSPYYWIHFAVVYEQNGMMSAYINGELVTSVAAGALPIATNSDDLIIGIAPWDLSNFQYFGSMDEVRLWNVARTQAEIQSTLHSELTGSETGLILYYDFNGSNGSSFTDVSPAGNDGTGNNTGAANVISSMAVLGDADMSTMMEVKGLWNALGTTDPRFVTTTNGMSMTASNIAEDDYVVFGHDGGMGTSAADIAAGAPANFERADRVWYLNEVGDMMGNFIIDLDNTAGGGATLATGQSAVNYTLLYRSGATGDFSPVFGGNAINGNVVQFNDIPLESGYYTIGVGDDMWVGSTSLQELDEADQLKVYPNPSSGLVSIALMGELNLQTIEVVNALGAVVYTESMNGQTIRGMHVLDLEGLEDGIYFVRLSNGEYTATRRIMITK